MEIMYYLWRGKNGHFYITDYKEVSGDGLVQIDGFGFIEVELVFSDKIKAKCFAYAEKLNDEIWKKNVN